MQLTSDKTKLDGDSVVEFENGKYFAGLYVWDGNLLAAHERKSWVTTRIMKDGEENKSH